CLLIGSQAEFRVVDAFTTTVGTRATEQRKPVGISFLLHPARQLFSTAECISNVPGLMHVFRRRLSVVGLSFCTSNAVSWRVNPTPDYGVSSTAVHVCADFQIGAAIALPAHVIYYRPPDDIHNTTNTM